MKNKKLIKWVIIAFLFGFLAMMAIKYIKPPNREEDAKIQKEQKRSADSSANDILNKLNDEDFE